MEIVHFSLLKSQTSQKSHGEAAEQQLSINGFVLMGISRLGRPPESAPA
jgi:hypothetical protein